MQNLIRGSPLPAPAENIRENPPVAPEIPPRAGPSGFHQARYCPHSTHIDANGRRTTTTRSNFDDTNNEWNGPPGPSVADPIMGLLQSLFPTAAPTRSQDPGTPPFVPPRPGQTWNEPPFRGNSPAVGGHVHFGQPRRFTYEADTPENANSDGGQRAAHEFVSLYIRSC
jgi:hypothetical protein